MVDVSYLEGEYGGGGWCWSVLTGNPGITTVCSTPKIGSPPPIEFVTAPLKCVCWIIPLVFDGEDMTCFVWLLPSIPNDSSLKLKYYNNILYSTQQYSTQIKKNSEGLIPY